ncbi:hypothetical protein KC19_8G099700 [Ceratodon purpureus]|uniref:DUF7748 domain-containing protein n=1 Tax=Ceratodon purpureus TaxID=3225 RepID=A0A8T0GX05_CERPU|nr:hypothetical protein KC19_8G099700 [Ceratodon purpureus]
MGLKTKVLNTTNKNFLLQEGNAGVYRLLKTLPPKKSYIIDVDPNATYREYWCAVKDDDPKAVIFSSDDCQEYAEIRIKGNIGQVGTSQAPSYYSWDGDRRNPEEPSNKSFLRKFMQKLLLKLLSKVLWKVLGKVLVKDLF